MPERLTYRAVHMRLRQLKKMSVLLYAGVRKRLEIRLFDLFTRLRYKDCPFPLLRRAYELARRSEANAKRTLLVLYGVLENLSFGHH